MRLQKGFSLAEILIASLISSLLLSLSMHQYLAVKKQLWHAERVVEKSLALQTAVDLIRYSVRRAGFTPCMGLQHLDASPKSQFGAIELNPEGVSGFRTHRMDDDFSFVKKTLNKTTLLVASSAIFYAGDVVLIADCYHAELREITAVHHHLEGVLLTLNTPLTYAYIETYYVGRWITESFFVRAHHMGLMYQQNRSDEIVPDISRLQVLLSDNNRMLSVSLYHTDGKKNEIKTALRMG